MKTLFWSPLNISVPNVIKIDLYNFEPYGFKVGAFFPRHMPNTHRRRRRDSTVELSRVGGVYAPVVSRDPVSNFLRQS